MSYKRISVRFNMDADAERKAWEIIHEKGNGLVGKEVISAINTSSELSNLEKMIRKVVSEELKKALFIPFEPAARNPETEESETEISNKIGCHLITAYHASSAFCSISTYRTFDDHIDSPFCISPTFINNPYIYKLVLAYKAVIDYLLARTFIYP